MITITTDLGEKLTLTKSIKSYIHGGGDGFSCPYGCERVTYKANDGSCWYKRYGQWNEAKVSNGALYESFGMRYAEIN